MLHGRRLDPGFERRVLIPSCCSVVFLQFWVVGFLFFLGAFGWICCLVFVCLFVLCVCPFGFPSLPAFPCSLFLVTRIYQAFRSPIKLLLLLTVRSTASTVIALQSYFSLYVFIFPAQELYFYSFCLPFSLQPFVSFLTHHA